MTFWARIDLAALLVASLAAAITPAAVMALETDGFTDRLVMIRELPDEGSAIDAHINEELGRMLALLNEKRPGTVEGRLEAVREVFESSLLPDLLNPVENWLNAAPIARYKVHGMGVFGGKVDYDDVQLAWYSGLAPVLKVEGVLAGIDKLGHFFGQGIDYYKRYLAMRAQGIPEAQALRRIREYGHSTEQGPLGLGTDGVYSYGDLAANWQGFVFFRELFDGPNPFFRRRADGSYAQVRKFTFADYITDDFDEVLNPSRLRTARFLEHFRKNFRKVCEDYRANPKAFLNETGRRVPFEAYTSPTVKHSKLPNFADIREICGSVAGLDDVVRTAMTLPEALARLQKNQDVCLK